MMIKTLLWVSFRASTISTALYVAVMLIIQGVTSQVPVPAKEPYHSMMTQQLIPMVTFQPEQAIVMFVTIFVVCFWLAPRLQRFEKVP
jgi:hypothetical protein